ncbi:recombinase family protein [Mesorhizobium sp. M7A.F.Ca.MR.362.00.0.0]|uniref:recombinase family protein n=1 Tax=Mesorhizobium sp. M7A.F.Ca.MR.362.00.0.0 TaxID=2496779 RepID=UPI000FD48ACA|nr:recombinase family protein [Mesorhizobium sp. M7A.F.Ca.MR.362.00.0.0]RUU82752.1 recombinase family protein [Mesorhizobium sp. M7A.F.Ca.MR.362.00.0.0]RWN96580.1 MAG: recombinase family protein [Mesorhizobium sp.]
MTELTSDLRVPAAQYIRMSTEHQRYSLENQTAAIAEYAEARGLAVVRTYADSGKSGLSLKGRDGLKQLLTDVVTGQHAYSAVLVLDVSRWGRFQDTDQAAHYEFICRDAGVAVEYCGEPFENDGSMVSSIVKNLKRVMAGEYSRELSAKISRAQIQQARLGFKQGGPVPYGVRRLLVTKDGTPRFLLGPGEQKGLSTDRVVVVPGPPEEIRTVRRIFRMFVDQKRSMLSIVKILNSELVPSTDGLDWATSRVRTVLGSELMIGYYVYNRTTQKMMGTLKHNPSHLWTRTKVMDPIVDPKLFARAQRELAYKRGYGFTKPDMIRKLKRLLRERKKLSSLIIDDCPHTPSAASYYEHFGSLRAAYAVIGYKCRAVAKRSRYYSDDELLDGIRRLHATFGYVAIALINADRELPACRVFTDRFGSMVTAYGLAGFPTTRGQLVEAARERARLRILDGGHDGVLRKQRRPGRSDAAHESASSCEE